MKQAADSFAWIANWACMIMLFGGLAMLSHAIAELQTSAVKNWEQARNERHVLKGQIDILAESLKISPKDVPPHVVKVEQMLESRCGMAP
jgi:hypothetical protein